jgi:hypothetical protein
VEQEQRDDEVHRLAVPDLPRVTAVAGIPLPKEMLNNTDNKKTTNKPKNK